MTVLSHKERLRYVSEVKEAIELSSTCLDQYPMDFYAHHGLQVLILIADTLADLHEESVTFEEPEELY